jgi:hypothetical protein
MSGILLGPDGTGGIWVLSLVGSDNQSSQLRRFSHGRWLGPVNLGFPLYQLAAVPGTASIWGVGTSKDGIRGLIVLQGPKPR